MKRLAIKKLSAMSTICHKSVADDVFMTYAEDITRWFHDKSSINLSVSSALCSVLENSDGRWFSFLHYFLFFMDNGSIEFSCVIIYVINGTLLPVLYSVKNETLNLFY